MNNNITKNSYDNLYSDIVHIIDNKKEKVYRAINTEIKLLIILIKK